MERPPVCDYEGSDYRQRFWQDQGRAYENLAERLALRRLMPPVGDTLIDIGAGFGRLANEYDGYRRVVLFDFSRSLLQEAQSHLGPDPRFIYVAGNWYQMPFVSGLFETLVQVRTIHHAVDVPALFRQLARIACPSGRYVLEFANKHHLKAILRYWSGRQRWSPFQHLPVEFVELNFDFHPVWIRRQLQAAGFSPGRMLTVSHFRLPFLKQIIPATLLAQLDGLAQLTGEWWQLSPSIFIYSQAKGTGKPAEPGTFFACPECGTPLGEANAGIFECAHHDCQRRWQVKNGICDFKDHL